MRKRHTFGLVVGAAAVAVGGTALAAPSFSDVPDTHIFYDDIEWLADTGVTTGYADGTYRPGDAVNRGSMAAFMRRLAGHDPEVDPVVNADTVDDWEGDELASIVLANRQREAVEILPPADGAAAPAGTEIIDLEVGRGTWQLSVGATFVALPGDLNPDNGTAAMIYPDQPVRCRIMGGQLTGYMDTVATAYFGQTTTRIFTTTFEEPTVVSVECEAPYVVMSDGEGAAAVPAATAEAYDITIEATSVSALLDETGPK